MKIQLLSAEERNYFRASHLITITEADLTQSSTATAQTLTVLPLAAGVVVGRVTAKVVTPFQDTGDSANNTTPITVGDGGSSNRYHASQELNTNGTLVSYKATANAYAVTTATNLTVTFTAPTTGKTLLALNAGEVHILVDLVDLAAI